MIKLKGGDDKNSILNQAAKRMNMPMANGSAPPGSAAAGGTGAGSSGGKAVPSAPAPIAERLGMPSALKAMAERKASAQQKDWSAHSNRINMGAPVFIQGRSQQQRRENNNDDDEDNNGDDNDNSSNSSNHPSSRFGAVQHLSRTRQTKGVKSDATSNLDWMDEENDLCDPGSDPTAAAIIAAATSKMSLSGGAGAHTEEKQEKDKSGNNEDDDDDEDDEEMRILNELRAKRMQELKKTTGRQQEFLAMGHGTFTEVTQDEFLPAVTKSKYVVCHFMHVEFERCKIIDKHLSVLAPRHLPTRFIKINAEKAPFFVQKLQVRMLPSIIMFKDGVATDRIVGFEALGGRDDFTTLDLEKVLAKSGVLLAKDDDDDANKRKPVGSIRSGGRGKRVANDSDDEASEDD